MNLNIIILLIIIGLSAGFLSGLLGIGGGIIIVPALVLLLGMTQHEAQGTSLAVLVFPAGILALMNYYKNGYVDLKVSIILILTFIIGGYFGSLVSMEIQEKVLRKIFSIFFILVAIRMFFK